LWGLRSCGYVTIGLKQFSDSEGGSISYNGISYEWVESEIPNLRPLQTDKYFAYVKSNPFIKLFKIKEQDYKEWISYQMVGPMFGGQELLKATSVALPTIQTFGTAELRICEYKNYNKVYASIDDKSIISNIVKILQDNDSDARKRREDFVSENPEFVTKSKVLLLSPYYPGLCLEYAFVQDERGKKYLQDVHKGLMYEIGNVLDSYYTE